MLQSTKSKNPQLTKVRVFLANIVINGFSWTHLKRLAHVTVQ